MALKTLHLREKVSAASLRESKDGEQYEVYRRWQLAHKLGRDLVELGYVSIEKEMDEDGGFTFFAAITVDV